MSKIDPFDIAILNNLQKNSRITSEPLAEAVGLSPTACQRRVKRLRDNGVIEKEIAVIDPAKVGGRITMIVQAVLERGRADILDDFKREIAKIPQVQQCYYVTGDFDFILIVTAKDIPEYEQLTHRIFFANPHIRRFQTIVVMDSVKVGLSYPL